MKYLYKALVDFPAFNIFAGMSYAEEKMTAEQKSLKDVNTVFEKVRDTSNELQVGDMVLATGRLVNTTVPRLNKQCIPNTNLLGENTDKMVAEILDIVENADGTDMWGVKLKGANGSIYWAYTKTLDRTAHSKVDPGHYTTKLVPGKVYFYISSGGCICRTVLGKDERADRFRKASQNYYVSYDAAHTAYMMIMGYTMNLSD